MVMVVFSFRAVFRKESWMFCAGLLSICRSPLSWTTVIQVQRPVRPSQPWCCKGERNRGSPNQCRGYPILIHDNRGGRLLYDTALSPSFQLLLREISGQPG